MMFPLESGSNNSKSSNSLFTVFSKYYNNEELYSIITVYDVISKGNVKSVLTRYLKNLDPPDSVDNCLEGPIFKQVHHDSWQCTCFLLWPYKVKFEEVGHSKKEATKRTVLACILWLKNNFQLNSCSKKQDIKLPISGNSNLSRQLLQNNLLPLANTRKDYSTSTDQNSKVSESTKDKTITKVQNNRKGLSSAKTPISHETICKLFPSPKNVLHNAYDLLAKELNNKELKLAPHYKLIRDSKRSSSWSCSYNLKWPENLKFTENATTKAEASRKAAAAALIWLKTNEKINRWGQPIIYNQKVVSSLIENDTKSFKLDNDVINKMKDVTTIYKDMIPYIVQTKGSSETSPESSEYLEDKALTFTKQKQRYLGVETYLAKEPTDLPVCRYKNEISKLLESNRVLIVKGEPGCGKSTRIPQYVLEEWAKGDGLLGKPCRIVVTQPRRIAAISLAERVASERNEQTGKVVGYQVRLKSSFSPYTGRLLYCTTGILLRYIQNDPHLSGFSHIILDEAHERDVNTDLLMNLVKKALVQNKDLKLIVMSATIDTDMFQNYFKDAAVIEIPGFTYPVKSYFLDQCRSLDLRKTETMCESRDQSVIHEEVVDVIKYLHRNKPEGAILCFLPGWDDIYRIKKLLPERSDMCVLCLHSRLQDSDQYKIFSRLPPGIRKVILATNIAETSVTIDDVVYVIDTGIHKEQRFDIEKGVMCIDNHWISQSSMIQRKGRAGRVQAGESYHLYPRSKAAEFDKFALPEILRTSLTKIVLDSKVYSNNMNALEFMNQLPCPPEESAVKRAVYELQDLDLLDDNENLTSLGRTLAEFQLEPKLSKAMLNSVIFKCTSPIVDIVTLFSADSELFASGLTKKEDVRALKAKYSQNSDHLALMRLFQQWSQIASENDSWKLNKFCRDTGLIMHKMGTIEKLRKIHFDYLYNGLYDVLPITDTYSNNEELVKAVLLSGVGNFLYHRNWDFVKGRYKKTNLLLTRNNAKATLTSDSVNSKKGKYPTNYLLYINETRSDIRRITVIRESSFISPLMVLMFSNKDIIVSVPHEQKTPDEVLMSLKDTNFKVFCDKNTAKTIVECREAILAGYKFYVLLLTQGGDYHPKVIQCWDKILALLSDILKTQAV